MAQLKGTAGGGGGCDHSHEGVVKVAIVVAAVRPRLEQLPNEGGLFALQLGDAVALAGDLICEQAVLLLQLVHQIRIDHQRLGLIRIRLCLRLRLHAPHLLLLQLLLLLLHRLVDAIEGPDGEVEAVQGKGANVTGLSEGDQVRIEVGDARRLEVEPLLEGVDVAVAGGGKGATSARRLSGKVDLVLDAGNLPLVPLLRLVDLIQAAHQNVLLLLQLLEALDLEREERSCY